MIDTTKLTSKDIASLHSVQQEVLRVFQTDDIEAQIRACKAMTNLTEKMANKQGTTTFAGMKRKRRTIPIDTKGQYVVVQRK